MKRVVAIHQPNFLPWLGYFNKIARADVFVFLDNVQFTKTGGTWTNRVRIGTDGEARWLTVPVVRTYHGVRQVREMKTAPDPWRAKLIRTIQHAYARASHCATVLPFIEALIGNPTDELAGFNMSAILALARRLKLDHAEYVVASDLGVHGQGTALLVDVVKAVGGSAYLCGGGAAGYQEDARFLEAGVELLHQNFVHPSYDQRHATFVPGLSIVDALMHCGFDDARALVQGARPEGVSAVGDRVASS